MKPITSSTLNELLFECQRHQLTTITVSYAQLRQIKAETLSPAIEFLTQFEDPAMEPAIQALVQFRDSKR